MKSWKILIPGNSHNDNHLQSCESHRFQEGILWPRQAFAVSLNLPHMLLHPWINSNISQDALWSIWTQCELAVFGCGLHIVARGWVSRQHLRLERDCCGGHCISHIAFWSFSYPGGSRNESTYLFSDRFPPVWFEFCSKTMALEENKPTVWFRGTDSEPGCLSLKF